MKAIKSAARPDPSQTTIGTGGSSVTYSKTALIVLVPPSMTKQTIGMGLWVTKIFFFSDCRFLILLTHMDIVSVLICIFPVFSLRLFPHHIFQQSHYRLVGNKRVYYLKLQTWTWNEICFVHSQAVKSFNTNSIIQHLYHVPQTLKLK